MFSNEEMNNFKEFYNEFQTKIKSTRERYEKYNKRFPVKELRLAYKGVVNDFFDDYQFTSNDIVNEA